MPMSGERHLRRSETIDLYSPGAIYDAGGESFVVVDTTQWPSSETIHEPRLQQLLHVDGFRLAPTLPADGDLPATTPGGVPVLRFPRWLFCPRCRAMIHHDDHDVPEPATHPRCTCAAARALAPIPYVMICAAGHLADVPWFHWVHANRRACTLRRPQLFYRAVSGNDSQAGAIHCACGASRSLAAIRSVRSTPADTAPAASPLRCPGDQPWQPLSAAHDCQQVPLVTHRNARNVHFPGVVSAIDIPPHADYDPAADERERIRDSSSFKLLLAKPSPSLATLDAFWSFIAGETRIPVTKVRDLAPALLATAAPSDTPLAGGSVQLAEGEYLALLAPDAPGHPRNRFQKRRQVLPGNGAAADQAVHAAGLAAAHLGELVQVTRLREVRVCTGFSRVTAAPPRLGATGQPGDDSNLVSPSLGQPLDWLPGIEAFGEGIFLTLNSARLREWEAQPAIQARVTRLVRRAEDAWIPGQADASVTARLILLHTLSHLVMRQLSFTCGYPLAALRERIYAAPADAKTPMAGILIATTGGDELGTLGGLVREGEPRRFLASLVQALLREDWCAADPLCRESPGQGPGALNLAACHACVLVPETSCALGNKLLDRTLVLGTAARRTDGYFGEIVTAGFAAIAARQGAT